MKKSSMQVALTKVLSSMNLNVDNKVLISLTLTSNEQIGAFLKWLKDEILEEDIESREDEIVGKAVKIAKEIKD